MESKKLGELFDRYSQLASELEELEPKIIAALRQTMDEKIPPKELAEITHSFMQETSRFINLITGLVALDKMAITAKMIFAIIDPPPPEQPKQETSKCADCPVVGTCSDPEAVEFRESASTN